MKIYSWKVVGFYFFQEGFGKDSFREVLTKYLNFLRINILHRPTNKILKLNSVFGNSNIENIKNIMFPA